MNKTLKISFSLKKYISCKRYPFFLKTDISPEAAASGNAL